jgi:uncharacterized protein involved in response to NO
MILRMDAAVSALFIVFDTIAVLIIALALFMVVTGKDVVPNVLRARLRRVAATPRDQRLVGAAAIIAAVAILLLSVATATRSPFWDLAALACLTSAIVLNLLARRVDRRENRVSSGWEDIMRGFR